VAAGLLNALRQAGSLFGVAIAGATTILAPRVSIALWWIGGVGFVMYALAALMSAFAPRWREGERAR
jgi:uncharacterized membrane protein HdeD (DUF308 family)